MLQILYVTVQWRRKGGGTGGTCHPNFSKVPFFREQSALYLREKCRLDCIFCPMAFDLGLDLFLYLVFPEKLFYFRVKYKILICAEKKFWFSGKNISGKFFSTSGKFLSFSGKNVICPEKFLVCTENVFEINSPPPPPVANISGKNFLGALFNRKVLLEDWPPPPPTFRCFLRPCDCIFVTYVWH